MKLFLCLLLVCLANGRQVRFARARLNDPQAARQERPEDIIGPSPTTTTTTNTAPNVQCYGLARETRTRTVQVPILHNRFTGETSRIPSNLLTLDGTSIDRMEAQGWEVRIQSMPRPEPVYKRVPVCCPWDASCQQGKPMTSTSIPSVPRGPCANGGQIVIRNGVQACQCPPGFKGAWCHIPDLIQRTQTPSHRMPTGPSIPYNVPRNNPNQVTAMLQGLVKQAQIWKQKMYNDNAGLMNSLASQYGQSRVSFPQQSPGPYQRGTNMSPMLSPSDHLLNAINRQLGRPISSVASNQALKMKMAMLVDWYMKQYGQIMRGQAPQMTSRPQIPGMNAYPRFPITGQMHPMMSGPMQGGQGMANPYSAIQSQQLPNRNVVAMMNQMRQDPRMTGPYANTYGSMGPYGHQPGMGSDMGVNGPKARTPWDLDPFDRNPGSKFMGGVPEGRNLNERQLMALAFYKYVQNLQSRAKLNSMNGARGMPSPLPVPPMSETPMPPMPQMPPMSPMPQIPQMPTIDSVEPPMLVEPQGNEPSTPMEEGIPTLVQEKPVSVVPLTAAQQPMNDAQIDDIPSNSGPMRGPPPPRMPGGPGMTSPPSPEELRKMEECRLVLVPKIDECLKSTGHDLTLEQFMNPQFMETARGICTDSQPVGQCIMGHDQACGQGDGVTTSRRMIDSALHMMGMVCQQILNGGPKNMPPPGMPGVGANIPQAVRPGPPPGMPHLPPVPGNMAPIPSTPQEESRPPMVSSEMEPEPVPPVNPTQSSENTISYETKKTTTKFEHIVTENTPSSAASKGDNGHHGKEALSTIITVFGWPLWIVLTASSILLLLLLVTTIVLCVCIRKRRRQKEIDLQTEVTRLPQPLDSKFYTLAIPPPAYPCTVTVKQTQDGLALPPLEVGDIPETVSVDLKEESGDGDDSSIKKPPISDDDADDESDDKEDKSNKKKKDKKEKK